MKRFVVITLLCIGVLSVGAIAASSNESVQILNQAEKAGITAGALCHSCNDCEASKNCDGAANC